MLSIFDVNHLLEMDLRTAEDALKMTELGVDSLKLMLLIGLMEEQTPYRFTEDEIVLLRVKDVKAIVTGTYTKSEEQS